MQALNPLYQANMGQRTGLSFGDIKAINMAYCADKCSPSSLARQCEHGGYQDPNNCHRCVCPDGFDGPYCDQLAKSTHGKFTVLLITRPLFAEGNPVLDMSWGVADARFLAVTPQVICGQCTFCQTARLALEVGSLYSS